MTVNMQELQARKERETKVNEALKEELELAPILTFNVIYTD